MTTARGLNLKKSKFNKDCTIVKSKDANKCHYKWGHVRILSSMLIFYTTAIYKVISHWNKKSGSGWNDDYGANARTPGEKEVLEEFMKMPKVKSTLIWRIVLLIIYKACLTQSLHHKTMAALSKNAGLYAWYPASRNAHFQSCQLILPVGYAITQFCQYRGGRGRGSRSSP